MSDEEQFAVPPTLLVQFLRGQPSSMSQGLICIGSSSSLSDLRVVMSDCRICFTGNGTRGASFTPVGRQN